MGTSVSILSNYSVSSLNSGSASSTAETLNEIVLFLMPTYYISTKITNRDIQLSQGSWNLILSNKSKEFLRQNQAIEFQEKFHGKCLNWFTDVFYQRFFDIHPMAKSLFSNNPLDKLKKQISKVISLALSQHRDTAKFIKLMKELAQSHCNRGVQAIEYGIMGNVLFFSLEKCIGKEQYPAMTDVAWKSIYSSMLRQIVPECVKYELEQRSKNQLYQQYRSEEYNRNASTEESLLDRFNRLSPGPASSFLREFSSGHGSYNNVEYSFKRNHSAGGPQSPSQSHEGELACYPHEDQDHSRREKEI